MLQVPGQRGRSFKRKVTSTNVYRCPLSPSLQCLSHVITQCQLSHDTMFVCAGVLLVAFAFLLSSFCFIFLRSPQFYLRPIDFWKILSCGVIQSFNVRNTEASVLNLPLINCLYDAATAAVAAPGGSSSMNFSSWTRFGNCHQHETTLLSLAWTPRTTLGWIYIENHPRFDCLDTCWVLKCSKRICKVKRSVVATKDCDSPDVLYGRSLL